MAYSANVKDIKWRDISTEHAWIRDELEKYVRVAGSGDWRSQDYKGPLAIVGSYGAGKSELMKFGFKKAWQEGVPALFVHLDALLRGVPDTVSVGNLPLTLARCIVGQREQIGKFLEDNVPSQDDLWVPDLEKEETLSQYFQSLELDPKKVKETLDNCPRTLLFIDEMEQAYTVLRAKVQVSDKGPLRAILEAHVLEKFYPVMGFALVSAYELLGGAQAEVEEGMGAERRRFHRLTLPLPEPEHFARLAEMGGFRNLLWWASRGRPGWALPLLNSWLPHLQDWRSKRLEDLEFYIRESIDGQAVEWSHIPNIPAQAREFLKHLVLCCYPLSKDALPSDNLECALGDLATQHLVLVSSYLSSVDEVVTALVQDLRSLTLRDEFIIHSKGSTFDENLARRYLRRILEGVSADSKLAFGGWKFGNEAFAQACVAPILTLLHDLILGFENTREAKIFVEFLDALLGGLGVWQNRIDVGKVVNNFPETRRVFRDTYTFDEATNVQASFSLISSAFPSSIVNPVVRFFENAECTIDAQRGVLEAALQRGASFPEISLPHQDLVVDFIPIPSHDVLPKLQQLVFSPYKRADYLNGERITVLLNCGEAQVPLTLDYAQNKDLEVLVKQLKKVQVRQLEERRLRDFLVSLSYNRVLCPALQSYSGDLISLVDTLLEKRELVDRRLERSLRYFKELLIEKLRGLSELVVKEYQESVEGFFSKKGLPEREITGALGTMGRPRTVESILCALDAFYDPAQVASVLADLRSLETLQGLAEAGYGQLLRRYGSTKVGDLTAYQEALLTYFTQHGAFSNLVSTVLPAVPYEPERGTWDGMDLSKEVWEEETPLDLLWGKYAGEMGKPVLKALNVYYCLKESKDYLSKKGDGLKNETEEVKKSFEHLIAKVGAFNQKLKDLGVFGDNLISADKLMRFQREFERARKILEFKEPVPLGTLLVSWRFLREAVGKAKDKHDERHSRLNEWERKLGDILGLDTTLGKFHGEIADAFANNRSLKMDVVGDPEDFYSGKVKQSLEDAAKDMLEDLTPPYSLAGDIPTIDLRPFNSCYKNTQLEVDKLVAKTRAVDDIGGAFAQLRETMLNITQAFRGGSK